MKSEVSPTARALRTLELLQVRPGVRADDLARELCVSQRAVRRYVQILREAGLPVQSTRGPYGGYRLGRGLRLPPVVFTADEALGLVMGVLDGHHAASDPEAPVGAALGKIIRALPEDVAAQAAAVRNHAAAAPDRAAARPDPATTSSLVQAIAHQHRADLDYRTQAGSEWTVMVDPWAVVVRHGRWYLVCFSHRVNAVRTYRIDRIRGVAERDETFDPPENLDPVAALEDNMGAGWDYETDVLIEAPHEEVLPWVPRGIGRLEVVNDRTARLHGSTSNPAWYAEQLASIRAPIRVNGGPELRQAVLDLGSRLLAATRP